MRLLAAALYSRGGTLERHHAARVDCAELVIRTHQAGEPQVVLPCYGDRIFGQTGDDEMGFAWPWSWTPAIVEGLEGTQQGGVRYPVPSFLRYTGEYPETYERLKAMWKDPREPACARLCRDRRGGVIGASIAWHWPGGG
jgi:hypothetical protein